MTKLFNPNEGLFGRQGGPFLDDVERKQAEDQRAYVEGREPDYTNMQPYVGDQLRNEEQILQEQINGVNPPTLDELRDFKGVTAPVLVEIPDEVNEPDESGDYVNEGGDDEPESESVDVSGSDPFNTPEYKA